jgi:hypothetical protein
MSRPKRIADPARLNLLVEGSVKACASFLAAQRGLSMGQLISKLIEEESQRVIPATTRNGHAAFTNHIRNHSAPIYKTP